MSFRLAFVPMRRLALARTGLSIAHAVAGRISRHGLICRLRLGRCLLFEFLFEFVNRTLDYLFHMLVGRPHALVYLLHHRSDRLVVDGDAPLLQRPLYVIG
jgi:hypothetical protein